MAPLVCQCQCHVELMLIFHQAALRRVTPDMRCEDADNSQNGLADDNLGAYDAEDADEH